MSDRDVTGHFDLVDLARAGLKAQLVGAIGTLEWVEQHRAELEGEVDAVVARLAEAALHAQKRLDAFEAIWPRTAA